MSIGLRHLPRLLRRLFNEGSLPQQVAGMGALVAVAAPLAAAAWGWGEPDTWLAMALTGLVATAASTWVARRASAALLRVSDAAQSLRSEHLRDGLDVPLLNASAELFVLSARLRRLVLAVRRHRKELEALNHALGQRLHARTHELSTLQELSIGLAQQTDLHSLVDEALQALERTLSYSSASLWAREDLRPEGRVVLMGYRTGEGHEGLDGGDLSGMRLSRSNLKHYERIERERQTVVDNQVQHSFLSWLLDRVTDDARTSTLYRNSRSWVAQPLQFRDDVLGVMRVDHVEPGHFDPERVRLLQAVSSQAALAMHHSQLAEQARDLAVMAERNRIARDLHDAVSQTLFAAHVIAGTLGKALNAGADEALSQQAQSLGQLIQGALAEMRMLMLELRPDALEKMTFGELLKHAIDAQASRGGTHFVRHVASADRLSAPVRMQLYRIAQEALSNVSRHSGATEAEVQWVVQGPTRAMLRIRDNGQGFDTAAEHPGHFGLDNMKARAQEIGAVLTLVSAPGQGTDLTVQWGDPGDPNDAN